MIVNPGFSQNCGPMCRNSNTSNFNMGSMSQIAQMAIMVQMMGLLASVMGMASGNAPLSGSAPNFGQGNGSASPSGFLGSAGGGGSGGGTSAASGTGNSASNAPMGDAKDAGGGWVNPVGGSYRISSSFGLRDNPTGPGKSVHKAADMAGALNTPILAAKAGKVTVSQDGTTGYGKWIEIQHADGTKSRYGHLNGRNVQVGATVAAGQQIGKMGSTGNSTGSHLHFEVLNAQGTQVDPTKAMKL